MTKQALKEGLSLFGFDVDIQEKYVTFEHENIQVSVSRTLTEEEVKLLLMNVPHWAELANNATN